MIRLNDVIVFATHALTRHRFRSAMLLIAMTIGVASVVILTGLGEGARRFIEQEFTTLGSNLLIILPGRKETTGGMPPLTGESSRDLTLSDAKALQKLSSVQDTAPLVLGSVEVSHKGLSKEVLVIGTTTAFFDMRELEVARGSVLPDLPMERTSPVCIIGIQLKESLFGNKEAIGQRIRIGDQRYRVTGLLKPRGVSLGMSLDEIAFVPVASAQALFNTPGLFRVFLKLAPGTNIDKAETDILTLMEKRHGGELDVTVISPDSVLSAFDAILKNISIAITGIGSISLLVAGILIMNAMLITVSQRTQEIGLLKALGATATQIEVLLLSEAIILCLIGSLSGIGIGAFLLFMLHKFYPVLPFSLPVWSMISATAVALMTGLLFAYLPARKAGRLEPVNALMAIH